jgi:hypothetical protein
MFTHIVKKAKKKVSNKNMHECDFKSLECVFNTYKSDFYCIFHPHSVIVHAERDFHTLECNFDIYECEYDTVDFHTQSTSVIFTL